MKWMNLLIVVSFGSLVVCFLSRYFMVFMLWLVVCLIFLMCLVCFSWKLLVRLLSRVLVLVENGVILGILVWVVRCCS